MEQQAGFRAGCSCVNHIFTLDQLNEKRVARNREIHLLFVDLTKAYDTIPINKLWEVLERTTIKATVIQVVQQLYQGFTARVKQDHKLFETFTVTKGLRQGCSISPTLFKIYLGTKTMAEIMSRDGGMHITDETTLCTLYFANDQVVVAQDKEVLNS